MKELISKLALNIFLKSFTVENLKIFIQSILDGAKELTAKTNTEIDDWAVEFFQSILTDDGKIEKLYDWIISKIQSQNTCMSIENMPKSSMSMLNELQSKPGVCLTESVPYDNEKFATMLTLEYTLINWGQKAQKVDDEIKILELPEAETVRVKNAIKNALDK